MNGLKDRTRYSRPSRRVKPTPEEEAKIREVWGCYKAAPNEELRNQLIERYYPLVRYNAERVHKKLPDEVDVEDLVSAGTFGMMDAIDAFDLERGVKFETYCAPRIRGAILDELRSMDWVPRLVRSRSGQLDKARKRFQKEHGRNPTDDEIRLELGVDEEEYAKILKDGSAAQTVSLTRKWGGDSDSGNEVSEIDVFKDERQADPLRAVQKRDLKEVVTKGLSRAERLIVMLYYYEDMTMKEIGATLDLSESRVSQMHTSILARLRSQMHRDGEVLEAATS